MPFRARSLAITRSAFCRFNWIRHGVAAMSFLNFLGRYIHLFNRYWAWSRSRRSRRARNVVTAHLDMFLKSPPAAVWRRVLRDADRGLVIVRIFPLGQHLLLTGGAKGLDCVVENPLSSSVLRYAVLDSVGVEADLPAPGRGYSLANSPPRYRYASGICAPMSPPLARSYHLLNKRTFRLLAKQPI